MLIYTAFLSLFLIIIRLIYRYLQNPKLEFLILINNELTPIKKFFPSCLKQAGLILTKIALLDCTHSRVNKDLHAEISGRRGEKGSKINTDIPPEISVSRLLS